MVAGGLLRCADRGRAAGLSAVHGTGDASAAAMGLWMAAVAGGQWLAGEVAAHWSMWSHAVFFLVLAALALAAIVVLALAARPIRRALADDDRAGQVCRTTTV